jgi:hypothetical protein
MPFFVNPFMHQRRAQTEVCSLNRIVINKMMDGKAWLFTSDTKPFMLESFNHDGKREIPLKPETLAERYRIPAEKIFAALSLVEAIKEPA